jgi:bacterioferritin-associated ferredoxin
MNRKQRRAMESQAKKGGAEEALATQAALFGKLPEECTACEAPFDKTDKEMISTWRVVVREQDKENPVRNYCPSCWGTAQEVLDNFLKSLPEEQE